MAANPSFDIVSKVDRQEVDNAFNQAEKELGTRFDFRGTGTALAKSGEAFTITSETEERATAALDVFKEKLVKRNISLKSLDAGEPRQSGKTYKIALIPHSVIERDRDRTTINLRKKGVEQFGYGKPLAGIIPRIREAVSDEEMAKMGFWYIVALHDPIKDAGGAPGVLFAHRFGVGRWLRAYWDGPDAQWYAVGASAFVVPGE